MHSVDEQNGKQRQLVMLCLKCHEKAVLLRWKKTTALPWMKIALYISLSVFIDPLYF